MKETELILALKQRLQEPGVRLGAGSDTMPTGRYGVASRTAIVAAERRLGWRLPKLYVRLLCEVANGGFGPSGGIFGVVGGHTDVAGRSVEALYADLRANQWPEGFLPLCDWGDGAWTSIDQAERIFTLDGPVPTLTRFTLENWLAAWMSGVDMLAETFETVDAVMVNPFTRKEMIVKRRGRAIGMKWN